MGLFSRSKHGASHHKGARGVPYSFAFLDVETTGLDPKTGHIVEIAIVEMDSYGQILHRWSALVNPGDGKAGRTDLHGISGEWLVAAPTFAQIAGDISARIIGRILVGYNSSFDVNFLCAEYERAGIELLLDIPSADAMQAAELANLLRGLQRACAAAGITFEPHRALDDAEATARLFDRLLDIMNPLSFSAAARVPAEAFPPLQWSGLAVQRDDAARQVRPTSFLATISGSLPPHDPDRYPDAEAASRYLAVLEEAIADSYLSPDEQRQLVALALSLGFSAETIADLHHDLVLRLIDVALEDNRITKAEKADIERAAAWLGVDLTEWDAMAKAARRRVKEARQSFAEEMRGKPRPTDTSSRWSDTWSYESPLSTLPFALKRLSAGATCSMNELRVPPKPSLRPQLSPR